MTRFRGPFFALLAAGLFGISPPLAKPLLGTSSAQLIAGLLYLGSGSGLGTLLLARLLLAPQRENRGRVAGRDGIWLAGAIAAGGIVAPVLLLTGLAHTAAATASLLLNMEGVFTALLAWFLFREGVNRKIAVGFALIVLGGVALSWTNAGGFSLSPAALLIVAACACWGIDNNLTRKVAHADAFSTAALKGIVAGIVNTALALSTSAHLPTGWGLGAALTLGFVSYGLSLVCFIIALRHVGAARTGAYFSTAPFIGALVAAVFFGEHLSVQMWLAGGLMAVGVWMHLAESQQEIAEALRHIR